MKKIITAVALLIASFGVAAMPSMMSDIELEIKTAGSDIIGVAVYTRGNTYHDLTDPLLEGPAFSTLKGVVDTAPGALNYISDLH